MELRHHELTLDLEFRHLDLLHKLRDSHMAKQHQMEKENQEAYTAQELRDLKHKHATATKQLPKNLKVRHVSDGSLCFCLHASSLTLDFRNKKPGFQHLTKKLK